MSKLLVQKSTFIAHKVYSCDNFSTVVISLTRLNLANDYVVCEQNCYLTRKTLITQITILTRFEVLVFCLDLSFITMWPNCTGEQNRIICWRSLFQILGRT